jgi:hypothetical protein
MEQMIYTKTWQRGYRRYFRGITRSENMRRETQNPTVADMGWQQARTDDKLSQQVAE